MGPLTLDAVLGIVKTAGSIIQAGGALAAKFKEAASKEGVTDADWDAVLATLDRVEANAKREIESTS